MVVIDAYIKSHCVKLLKALRVSARAHSYKSVLRNSVGHCLEVNVFPGPKCSTGIAKLNLFSPTQFFICQECLFHAW